MRAKFPQGLTGRNGPERFVFMAARLQSVSICGWNKASLRLTRGADTMPGFSADIASAKARRRATNFPQSRRTKIDVPEPAASALSNLK